MEEHLGNIGGNMGVSQANPQKTNDLVATTCLVAEEDCSMTTTDLSAATEQSCVVRDKCSVATEQCEVAFTIFLWLQNHVLWQRKQRSEPSELYSMVTEPCSVSPKHV